jgi:hypothetical protein
MPTSVGRPSISCYARVRAAALHATLHPVGGTVTGGAAGGDAAAGASCGGAAPSPAPGDDLLDLLGGLDAATAAVQRVSIGGEGSSGGAAGGGGGGLDDLLGVGGSSSVAAGGGGGGTSGGAADVMDLLGGGPTPASPAAAAAAGGGGGLDDLLGGATSSSSSAPAAATTWPPLTVFDQGGVKVVFAFRKPVPGDASVTQVTATFTNSGLDDIRDFVLQVGGCGGGALCGTWGGGGKVMVLCCAVGCGAVQHMCRVQLLLHCLW